METHTTPRTRITLTIATLTIALTGTIQPTGTTTTATGTGADTTETATVTVIGATDDEQALVDWAISRYQTAGLELPALIVTFHDTQDGCRGYKGYYNHATGTVDFCNRDSADPRRTMLHELGHAWSFEHMDGDHQHAFTESRGLDTWHDTDTAWWQMGQEHAAEIIAWGLQDDNEYQSVWLHLEDCTDLAAAFTTLTGTTPLHTNTHYCK